MNDRTPEELYEEAKQAVLETKYPPCVATVQRRLRIGWNRAQMLLEQLCDTGVLVRGRNGYERAER